MKNWLMNDEFPIIPKWEYYPRDEDSALSFYFRWLFLRIYNKEYLTIQLTIRLDSGAFSIYASLLYLFIEIVIPFPEFMEIWLDEKLTRRGNK